MPLECGPAQSRADPFHGLAANFYSLNTEKIPAGMAALGDRLGCYTAEDTLGILPNMGSRHGPV